MQLSLDPKARSPLYRQLVDQVRYAISVGDLALGDSLPSIRQLEGRLGINRNTVRQAYVQLEAEGLIELRQGREARVVQRPRLGPVSGGADARQLAESFVRRAEAEGLDAVLVAETFAGLARAHDAGHPRCVYLECSAAQAADFARQAEEYLGRRVLPVDLHDIRGGAGELPASVRVVMTPHWHYGEAREILEDRPVEIIGVQVRITDDCRRIMESLEGTVGVVVRDAESAEGYRTLLVGRARRATDVRVVLADDMTGLRALAGQADAIVYTTPCAEAVRLVAKGRIAIHEIVFETRPQDLDGIRNTCFPALAPDAAAT